MHTLIVTFSLVGLDASAFDRMARDSADRISRVPGLIGKTYVVNDARNTYGGVYFFQDRSAAEACVASDIIASLNSSPNVANLTTAVYDTVEDATRITQRQLGLVSP